MTSNSGDGNGADVLGRARGDWSSLSAALEAATGADSSLDQVVADAFRAPPADYTESVDHCRTLVVTALPGWHLHLGYGVSGVLPYAELSAGDRRHVAEAPTVPLAILRALVATKLDHSLHQRVPS